MQWSVQRNCGGTRSRPTERAAQGTRSEAEGGAVKRTGRGALLLRAVQHKKAGTSRGRRQAQPERSDERAHMDSGSSPE